MGQFALVTDHKSLTAILGPKKGVPPLAAARVQTNTSSHQYARTNTDALSRLPLANLTLMVIPYPAIFTCDCC